MVAQVIDGKAFAAKVRAQVADQVAKLKEESGSLLSINSDQAKTLGGSPKIDAATDASCG